MTAGVIGGRSHVYVSTEKELPWKRPEEPKWSGLERSVIKEKIVKRLALTDRMRKISPVLDPDIVNELLEYLGLDDSWFDPRIAKKIRQEETRRDKRRKK